ncbi:MAG: NUDIX hydrolase, partial [Campylobacter sp.]|nr:NUDIX hydrolase [Campylobacter sp.]
MDSIKILGISEFEKSNFVKPFRVEFSQNGLVRNWDCVKVHSSVSCLLYHEEKDAFLLVKQFRPAVWHSLKYLANLDEQTAINRAFTYELCAGITDKNLSEIDTMREEILEETGYKVD